MALSPILLRFVVACLEVIGRIMVSRPSKHAAETAACETRQYFHGVALLDVEAQDSTRRTTFLILYARHQVMEVDQVTREEKLLVNRGPGIHRFNIDAILPARHIVRSAGDCTDGEFRHHVLPDGTHTHELQVNALKMRWVSVHS